MERIRLGFFRGSCELQVQEKWHLLGFVFHVIFYGFYHGIHHHEKPPFARIFLLELFPGIELPENPMTMGFLRGPRVSKEIPLIFPIVFFDSVRFPYSSHLPSPKSKSGIGLCFFFFRPEKGAQKLWSIVALGPPRRWRRRMFVKGEFSINSWKDSSFTHQKAPGKVVGRRKATLWKTPSTAFPYPPWN